MIERLDITGVHMDVDDNLRKYLTQKIGRLDRYMPKHGRESAHAEIRVKESKSKDRRQSTCEVTLHLPQEVINVSETTMNIYAAVDICEAKLRHQITKYKQLHVSGSLHRRLAQKFQRKSTVAADAEL